MGCNGLWQGPSFLCVLVVELLAGRSLKAEELKIKSRNVNGRNGFRHGTSCLWDLVMVLSDFLGSAAANSPRLIGFSYMWFWAVFWNWCSSVCAPLFIFGVESGADYVGLRSGNRGQVIAVSRTPFIFRRCSVVGVFCGCVFSFCRVESGFYFIFRILWTFSFSSVPVQHFHSHFS